jgi:hypothetical protein
MDAKEIHTKIIIKLDRSAYLWGQWERKVDDVKSHVTVLQFYQIFRNYPYATWNAFLVQKTGEPKTLHSL